MVDLRPPQQDLPVCSNLLPHLDELPCNTIEASWLVLVDGFEFHGLKRDGGALRVRPRRIGQGGRQRAGRRLRG